MYLHIVGEVCARCALIRPLTARFDTYASLCARSILSLSAPTGQSSVVFAFVFVMVWAGAAVVTANAKLLGGNM